MPLTKRKYAPKKKMIRRKRMNRVNKRVLVNNALHPIPQRFITKMKYSEQITTDANGNYKFNLNSIYDPNRTGTGHQPYGFDTLATLYNRYRVISCGFRVQASPGQFPILVASLPANEPLTILSSAEIRENPRAKYIVQTPGGNSITLSGKVYMPSLMGRNKVEYMADDRYQALTTADPQENAILNLVTSSTGSDAPSSAALQVLLEYTVEFFDIKNLAQS